MNNFPISLLADVSGAAVLDAGCGPGFFTQWLLDQGAQVTAFDVSNAQESGLDPAWFVNWQELALLRDNSGRSQALRTGSQETGSAARSLCKVGCTSPSKSARVRLAPMR